MGHKGCREGNVDLPIGTVSRLFVECGSVESLCLRDFLGPRLGVSEFSLLIVPKFEKSRDAKNEHTHDYTEGGYD